MKPLRLTVAAILIISSHAGYAIDRQPVADSTGKSLLFRATPGPNGIQVKVGVADRSKINKDLYVDMTGLRLWMDSPESVKRLRALIVTPVAALSVKRQLGAKLMETGVEPDTIPVRGEEGKKADTKGMVLLEGGEFTRTGEFWDSSGGGLDEDQKPSRGDKYRVRVSSFYIDKFKVTNQDYCRFLNDGNAGYRTPWNLRIAKAVFGRNRGKFVPVDASLAMHPVVLVNWYQAKGYAAWAWKRLPTEAEWEYAAGGKEGRKYPWGNEPPDEARADIPIKYKHPIPVDWYPKGATPEGVFQMAGNSAEWCADYFDTASYVKAPPGGVAINPTGAQQAFQPNTWYKFRVMFKGWCKTNRAEYFTCTKRHSRPPLADASAGVSFRCVKNATPQDKARGAAKAQGADAAKPKSPERAKIDQPVKDFRLRDLMQEEMTHVTLSQFRDKKVVVLVSIQSRCPFTWRYIGRIGKLFEEYQRKGVAVLLIRSSLTDSKDRIRRYAEDKNLDMPLLYDEAHRVADYFGTQGTPYFYVIDKKGILRYEGICDNNQTSKRFKMKPETVTVHYVRDAIKAVLAGKPVQRKSIPKGAT